MIPDHDSDEGGEQLSGQPGERVRERETREFMHSLLTAYQQDIHRVTPDERIIWMRLGACGRQEGRSTPTATSQIVHMTAYGAELLTYYCEGYLAECTSIRERNGKFLSSKRER
jgi:hypothetical protein